MKLITIDWQMFWGLVGLAFSAIGIQYSTFWILPTIGFAILSSVKTNSSKVN